MLNLEFSKWHSIEGGEGCTGGPGAAAACMNQGMRQHLPPGAQGTASYIFTHIHVRDIQRYSPYLLLRHEDILHSMPPQSLLFWAQRPHPPCRHLHLRKLRLFHCAWMEQGLLPVDRP